MYQLRQHPTYRRLSAHFGAGRGGRQRGPPLDDMANDLNYDLDHRNSRNHISNDRLSPEPDPHEKPLTAHDFADWERIGRGGFGKVYRATPRSTAPSRLPETVAIKVVDKRTLKGSAAEMRLAAEVAIHETMQHESIVEVLDSFEDDRFVYIVMEHCTGGDLWRYLRQRHADQHLTLDAGISEEGLAVLSEGETRAVMRQVCAAVHHIHTRGAIHRDLKLANIFLTGRGLQAKVGDFGLATWLRADRSMEPVTVCGTPSYISPEMLARRPYGFESDIWALGCLMVALLTGAQPFGRGFTGKITEDRVARIQLPSDLSSEARDLVAAMLRVDPNRRIRSANILQHPFFTGNHARNARANERLLTLDQAREMARRQQVKEQQQLKQQRLLDNRHSTSVLLREQQLQKRNAAGRMLLPKHSRQVDSAMAQNASTLHHHHQNNHHVQQTVDVGRLATRDPQTAATVSSNTPSLQDLSIDRLPAMRRALKGGKLYVHPTPGLLILDLTTAPTAIALDTNQKLIFEYRKPLQTSTLSNTKPIQAHPWDLGALSENIAKTVRVALRCISHIRAQQKRLYVATPQGRAYLYDDGPDATFRLAFFNGIRVEIARRRGLATVEIPSNQDLPDEIQKIPLLASDFPAEATPLGQTSDSRMMLSRGGPRSQPIPMVGSDAEVALEARVPSKIRAIIAHAQEALLRLLQADPLLADYEPGGRLHSSYDGRIEYPVELPWSQWDSSGTLDLPAHYIPPGLKPNAKKLNRRSAIDDIDHRFDERHNGHGSMPSAVGHIGGASTTVFSGTTATVNTVATTATAIVGAGEGNSRRRMVPLGRHSPVQQQQQQPQKHRNRNRHQQRPMSEDASLHAWGAHMLDRRTIQDTPTRRLNLGPITRLVEEFNQTPAMPPTHIATNFLRTPMRARQPTTSLYQKTPPPQQQQSLGANNHTNMLDMANILFHNACFMPDVGWCIAQESTDEECCAISLFFLDGCRLLVNVLEQVASYKDRATEYTDLPFDHSMPQCVKEKLVWLPHFLNLMNIDT